MRSWATSLVFTGFLALSLGAAAVQLPRGQNTPTNEQITLTGAGLEGVGAIADATAPARVLPSPAILSTRVNVKITSKQPVPADVPAGELAARATFCCFPSFWLVQQWGFWRKIDCTNTYANQPNILHMKRRRTPAWQCKRHLGDVMMRLFCSSFSLTQRLMH